MAGRWHPRIRNAVTSENSEDCAGSLSSMTIIERHVNLAVTKVRKSGMVTVASGRTR